MDGNSINLTVNQLPTQNEVYQIHNNTNYNNEQTPSNYIPPSIFDNNISQEINQDNNESRLSSLDAPPTYNNYQPSGVKDPLSQDNLNIYNKSPQSIGGKEISQETNSVVEEPVYQLQVEPYQNYNDIFRPCCQCCCGEICCDCDRCSEDCCDECNSCCDRCCTNPNCIKFFQALSIALSAAGGGK